MLPTGSSRELAVSWSSNSNHKPGSYSNNKLAAARTLLLPAAQSCSSHQVSKVAMEQQWHVQQTAAAKGHEQSTANCLR
jgi:hypothetical protein